LGKRHGFRRRQCAQAAHFVSALQEDYLFTLRAIADNPELRCYGCGNSIRLGDSVYEPLVSDVRTTLEAIDSAPPSFISARPRLAILD